MNRYRFRIPGSDGRPVVFPPPGPFWITGYGDDDTVVVAYCTAGQIKLFWPDAFDIDDGGEQEISFSSRFPQPAWWTP